MRIAWDALKAVALLAPAAWISGCGGGGASGSGVLPPRVAEISVNDAALNFTSATLSAPANAQVVTVTNSGTGPLSITAITITGQNAAAFSQTNTCSSTVPAGNTCSVTVSFSPTASGSLSATLGFSSNAATNPTVSLTGTSAGLVWNVGSWNNNNWN